MLIRVKSSKSFYGERGSARMKREDESRYKLRAGMARVALRTKASGREECDARGTPLKYSNQLAQGHSASTLEHWAKGRSTSTTIGTPGNARRTPWPWEEKDA